MGGWKAACHPAEQKAFSSRRGEERLLQFPGRWCMPAVKTVHSLHTVNKFPCAINSPSHSYLNKHSPRTEEKLEGPKSFHFPCRFHRKRISGGWGFGGSTKHGEGDCKKGSFKLGLFGPSTEYAAGVSDIQGK